MPVELNVSAVTVSVEAADPSPDGVTVFWLNETVTPLGFVPVHELVSVTASLKPAIDLTVMVDVSELPRFMDIVVFDDDKLKSGFEGVDVSVKVVLPSVPSQCNNKTVYESAV